MNGSSQEFSFDELKARWKAANERDEAPKAPKAIGNPSRRSWKPTREIRVQDPGSMTAGISSADSSRSQSAKGTKAPAEEVKKEFNSGSSFKQEDVELIEHKGTERRVSKGGYKFNAALRNTYDYSSRHSHDPVVIPEIPLRNEPDRKSFQAPPRTSVKVAANQFGSGISFPQEDVPYSPEPRRVSRGAFRYPAIARNVYDYDESKEWMKRTSRLPEYRVMSFSKEYRKPGTVRSHFDHGGPEQKEPEPLIPPHALPEYRVKSFSKEYRKPGTVRSRFDYGGPEQKEPEPLIPPHALPEYRVMSFSKEYRKPGTVRSRFDYGGPVETEPEPLIPPEALPEYRVMSFSKEYRKPGTVRSRFDYDTEEVELEPLIPPYALPEYRVRTKSREFRQQGTIRSEYDYEVGEEIEGSYLTSRQEAPGKSSRYGAVYKQQHRANIPYGRRPLEPKLVPSPKPKRVPSPKKYQKGFQRQPMIGTGQRSQSGLTRKGGFSADLWKEEGSTTMDLGEHSKHPDDYGTVHVNYYKEFGKRDGREVYVESEERISQLHHVDPEE